MAVFYLDTSALLKRYKTEQGSKALDELFDKKRGSELLSTSRFTVLEMTSVITRSKNTRTISENSYNQLLVNMAHDFSENVALLTLTDSILAEAINLIKKHSLRAPDALHLASALLIHEDFHDQLVYFFCADVKLLAAAVSRGLSVLNPEAEDSIMTLRNLRNDQGSA